MTIEVCRLKFTTDIAVDGKLTAKDMDSLREAIERTLKQYGYHASFMVGSNSELEISQEKYDASN